MVTRHPPKRAHQGRRRRWGMVVASLAILAIAWHLQPKATQAVWRSSRLANSQAGLLQAHDAEEKLEEAGAEIDEQEDIEFNLDGREKQVEAAPAVTDNEPAPNAEDSSSDSRGKDDGMKVPDIFVQAMAPPLLAPEAGLIQEQCGEVHRAEVAASVLSGTLPPVLSWGCSLLQQCNKAFVKRTAQYMRSTPRYASMLAMVPCDLWSAIQGRTLWIAGDIQSQHFYHQLRCFLADFTVSDQRQTDVPLAANKTEQERLSEVLVKGFGAHAALPNCTRLVGGTRLCHARINKGDHMLRYLKHLGALGLKQNDIWEFNVGLWHHQKEGEYPGLVAALADYYQQHRTELPVVIWRDTSPQHFVENGKFPHPREATQLLGGHKGCKPIEGVELQPDGSLGGENENVKAGGWHNQVANPVFKAVGMPIHATWNDTIDMHDGHTSGECTDFCSPGAYSLYAWSLWRLLLGLEQQAPAVPGQQQSVPDGSGEAVEAAAANVAAVALNGTGGVAAAGAKPVPGPPPLPSVEQAVDLRHKANWPLSRRVIWRSAVSAYRKCLPNNLDIAQLSDTTLEHLLRGSSKLKGQVVWVNVSSVPCRKVAADGTSRPGCCSKRFSFRFGSTDILVFQQIFRHHYLRTLYVLLRDHEPRYILDAGANAGFSTALFKLLFPNATVVSLEPDPNNYAALMRNTEEFEDVHRVQAGLWSRRANITQVFDDGDWGKIFKEAGPGEEGLPAYSVKDIAAMYGIRAFDYVKIDIEGAEGMVFDPTADKTWIQDAKLISLEVHDSFAQHFGLHAVTGRVNAAFEGLDYALTADNEHIFYIHPDIMPTSSLNAAARTLPLAATSSLG